MNIMIFMSDVLMKFTKRASLLGSLFVVALVFSQAPANYYSGTNGLSGAQLKTRLHQIIKNGHIAKTYRELYRGYQTTDKDNFYENDNTVLDMYSENPSGSDPYNYQHIQSNRCGSSYAGEGDCYNREHIVPQSLFDQNEPMKSDIHFVRPSDGKVNGERGNFPFGVVGNASYISQNGSKRGNNITAGYHGVVFEPIDEFKGDIARMIFYFVTRYEDKMPTFSTGNMLAKNTYPSLQNWQLQVLLMWHNQDPVSQSEIVRNNAAYLYQGNRNPFIDNPSWANLIWSNTTQSTDEEQNNKSILLYPNPLKDGKLFITGKGIEKIQKVEVYSSTGQLVKTIDNPFKERNYIDVRFLVSGTYFIVSEQFTEKIIVE